MGAIGEIRLAFAHYADPADVDSGVLKRVLESLGQTDTSALTDHSPVIGATSHQDDVAVVRDADTGATHVAVVKDLFPSREWFASAAADAFNMGSLVGTVRMLPDGRAAIPWIDGETADEAGIDDTRSLVLRMTSEHGRTQSLPAAVQGAVSDVARMLAFDSTLGVEDRNLGNVMLTDGGDLRLIDHEFVETRTDPNEPVDLEPVLHPTFMADPALPEIEHEIPSTQLTEHVVSIPDDVAHDFASVTREQLEPAFKLARAHASDVELPETYLDDVLTRAHVIGTSGIVRYRTPQ